MSTFSPAHFFKKIFFRSQFSTIKIEVGDKIIHHAHSELILIQENKRYLMDWGLKFIGVGILLLLFFVTRSSFKVNVYTLAMISAPALLFICVGIIYLKRAKEKVIWIVDLEKKIIFIDQFIGTPFDELTHFSIGNLSYDINHQRKSYYLNLITKKNRKLLLFKSDTHSEIQEAAYFLSSTMGIPFKNDAL